MNKTIWCPHCCQEVTYTTEQHTADFTSLRNGKVGHIVVGTSYICNNCDNIICVDAREEGQMAPGGIFFKRPTNE